MDKKALLIGIGIGVVASLVISMYVTSSYVASALSDMEKRNQETRTQDYVRHDLKSQELQVILVTSPNTVPAPELENIEGYDKVLSKPVRDRLNQFGVPVLYAHPHYVVPTYAPWDFPEHESAQPYSFGDRTIFVIEDKAIQERIDNPDFLQFFKDAAAKHATFVATGDTSLNSLRQLIERAEIQAPTINMHNDNPQMFAFKLTSEKGGSGAWVDISEMASSTQDLNAIPPIDKALFIIEFSRGQTELAKNLVLQRTPP